MADTFRVKVSIEIASADYPGYSGLDRLTVNDEFVIPAAGFTELAGIVGQFHALADKVKAEQRPEPEAI